MDEDGTIHKSDEPSMVCKLFEQDLSRLSESTEILITATEGS